MSTPDLRRRLVAEIYGELPADEITADIDALIDELAPVDPHPPRPWSVDDVWLITYADQFQADDEAPLRTLGRFFDARLADHLNGVHILPFFPWTSDDGFSVADYENVDARYGTWGDVTALTRRCSVMFDAVINHMSAESRWFEAFLGGDEAFAGFFVTADPASDLSQVVRPRTHPLLTQFEAASGSVWVWTTFSTDQVDLDYANPAVLVRVLRVLLDYARRGASAIRLDAIGFLWKELGTSCLHLPQTHSAIQLMRACLDESYPHVKLITETNVPHEENVSYFGSGDAPEAQAVYQFPLPPLVLHSFVAGDAAALRDWASTIGASLGPGRTYFNFLSSHDGVGLRPLEGLVADPEKQRLLDVTAAAGGEVSYRSLPDGSQSPYELNSTWFDLMAAGHSREDAIERHLSSHAIALALPGLVGVYVHSLFGTANDREGLARTGRNRTLNRRRFRLDEIEAALADPDSTEHLVHEGMKRLISLRRSSPAFAPEAPFAILDIGPGGFGIERGDGDHRARVYVNVTEADQPVVLDGEWHDLETGMPIGELVLGPYGNRWLGTAGGPT